MDPSATSFTPTPFAVAVDQGRRRLPRRRGRHGFNLGRHYCHNFAFPCPYIDLPTRHPPLLSVQKRQSRFFPTRREPTPPNSEADTKAHCVALDHQFREPTVSPGLSNLDGRIHLQRTISPFALPSPLSLPSPVARSCSEISEPTFSCASTLVDARSSASGSE